MNRYASSLLSVVAIIVLAFSVGACAYLAAHPFMTHHMASVDMSDGHNDHAQGLVRAVIPFSILVIVSVALLAFFGNIREIVDAQCSYRLVVRERILPDKKKLKRCSSAPRSPPLS